MSCSSQHQAGQRLKYQYIKIKNISIDVVNINNIKINMIIINTHFDLLLLLLFQPKNYQFTYLYISYKPEISVYIWK